ncbi:MAG: cupin domain-containing protein [Chitinophagaceae bacterium]|nr:cupin domain-containing protein [Chitinophagaceae bacterium]
MDQVGLYYFRIALFILIYSFFGIIIFASFLPELDRSIGIRSDRTIINSTDHYSVTFLKTSKETNGSYEEVKVELDPGGGNEWHYHTAFVEKFHVIQGDLTIGMQGKPVLLKTGNDTIAPKGMMHKFYNTSPNPVTFLVKIEPARSFEKTIRSAYGLMNTGQSSPDGIPKNPWHLFLILGYSDSYLQGVPGFIQEPLISALSKIAQWKGVDKDLDPFCK